MEFVLSELRFLGVIMDDGLTWKHLKAHVKTKVSKNISVLNKANFTGPPEPLGPETCMGLDPFFFYGQLGPGQVLFYCCGSQVCLTLCVA